MKIEQIIKNNWDAFLRAYYLQDCLGCPKGHSSFWRTIITSKEWEEWKKQCGQQFDVDECEEMGILGEEHWNKFVDFIKTTQPK